MDALTAHGGLLPNALLAERYPAAVAGLERMLGVGPFGVARTA